MKSSVTINTNKVKALYNRLKPIYPRKVVYSISATVRPHRQTCAPLRVESNLWMKLPWEVVTINGKSNAIRRPNSFSAWHLSMEYNSQSQKCIAFLCTASRVTIEQWSAISMSQNWPSQRSTFAKSNRDVSVSVQNVWTITSAFPFG